MSTQPLFSEPLYDVLCTFGILVGAMIAAGGGLGGGGVFVPIYILVLSFATKNAVALSQATIFGGSLVNLAMNWKTRHPIRKHRPLTDFGTLLVFEPMLLVGTVLGVLLNVMFPAMLILILLIVTLLYATYRITKKGYKMWSYESSTLHLQHSSISGYITNGSGPSIDNSVLAEEVSQGYDTTDSSLTDSALLHYDDKESLLRKSHTSPSESYGSLDGIMEDSDDSEQSWRDMAKMCGVDVSMLDSQKIAILRPLMEREKEIWKPMGIIAVIWIISSVTSIAKNSSITGVESCSILYWTVTFLSFPILVIISLVITKQQCNEYDLKSKSNGWLSAVGDIEWDKSVINMVKYPAIAMFAGLLGGLLGIGGGMIVSPLLMELGVLPCVAAATSAMAVLITSSSATLQFILLGYLNLDYTFYFMAVGILGTAIGQTIVSYCVKEYGRKSLIVLSVAGIMGGAVLLMGIDGILQVVNGISWSFSSPC